MSTRILNTLQRLVEGALGSGTGKSGVEGIVSEVAGVLGGHAHGRGGNPGASNVSRALIIRNLIHDEMWANI